MKQIRLDEIKAHEDPDWMFKPILKTNTRTDYDGNQIEFENMLKYE